MDLQTFIKEIQEYYNLPYPDGTLKFIIKYLENIDIDLGELFQKTIATFSGQYKTLPDIAFFETIIKPVKHNQTGHYPDIDPAIKNLVENHYDEIEAKNAK